MSQETLFDDEPPEPEWKREWQGMPEFIQDQQRPYAQLIVRFRSKEDLDDFARLIGQRLTRKSQCTWHPEIPLRRYTKRYVNESDVPALHSLERPLGESVNESDIRPDASVLPDSD